MLNFTFLILAFASIAFANNEKISAPTEPIKKNQVEDIFIWKISDELQLSAKQEKEFGDIQRSLNKRKSELSEQIKSSQIDIKKSDPKLTIAQQNKLIKKNRALLLQLNQLSVEEFDSTKKLFGPEKFLEYLFLKQELNNKFKSMVLGTRAEKPATDTEKSPEALVPVAPPVVIEEK